MVASAPSVQIPPLIEDFADPAFDPFAAYDVCMGHAEVNDPYPTFHAFRREGPARKGEIREAFGLKSFPMWQKYESYMVLGYENCVKALQSPDIFSNIIMKSIYEGAIGERSIHTMDPPEHRQYRLLLQQAFLPKYLHGWDSTLIPGVINRIIDQFSGDGTADLVRQFTMVYPFEVIYAQLGLAERDLPVFRKLAAGVGCSMIDYPHANEASIKMGHYFGRLIGERRGCAGDDLITKLSNAEVEGEQLTDEVIVTFLRQLMNAAGDTTYRSTGNLLAGLLTNPIQLAAVRAERRHVSLAMEESLRWEGPLPTTQRLTLSEARIGDVRIPPGAKVDIIIGSASRDPDRYEDPDRFDIFREPKRHIAFGAGPHLCLGQHLARIEMERAINILLDRLPNLRLDPQYPPPPIRGLHTRTAHEQHVIFDA